MSDERIYQVSEEELRKTGENCYMKQRYQRAISDNLYRVLLSTIPAGTLINYRYLAGEARLKGYKNPGNIPALLIRSGYLQRTNIKGVYRVAGDSL